MTPETLAIMPEKEQEAWIIEVWGQFRRSDAYPILQFWLNQLYLQAETVYLNPKVTNEERLMSLGQVQALKALSQRMQEPVNPGIAGLYAEDSAPSVPESSGELYPESEVN
jgi:hypothetical protein